MKIAYIILAHRYPQQVVRLVQRLNSPDAAFVIHLDSKMDAASAGAVHNGLAALPNVAYLPRISGDWGIWPIVQTTVDGLKLIRRQQPQTDYAVLLSGQSYPLRSNAVIAETLAHLEGKTCMTHKPIPRADWPHDGLDRIEKWHFYWRGRRFVFPEHRSFRHPVLKPLLEMGWSAGVRLLPMKRRFPAGYAPYGGSQWWCMGRQAIEYVCNFVEHNRRFVRYFHYTYIPDEMFFQTVLINSPLRDQVIDDDLHYIDWSKPVRPATLTVADLEAMLDSPDLFARKFDASVDGRVLDLLDAHIDQEAMAAPATV